MPIFLLNEVDGLFEHDLPLVEAWRGMNDIGKARFLMVGYSVINRMSTLGAPDSPFFNFTVGTDFGGKAISLGALSDPAAKELLDLLERGGLGLRWVSEAKKQTAYQELLQRSFCIPWVLQRYGQLLVENLESSRHDRIDYEDVAKMLKVEGGVVWQYIQAIDYSSLGYDKGTQDRVGFDIVLYTIARNRYFLGEAKVPIQDPRLRERNALDEELGFSVGDAKKIVTETLKELLFPKELQAFQQWFNALPLDQALRQLTLTLALEPDPEQHNRYGFLLHIVPLELYDRYGQADPTLDGLIAEKAAGLLNLVEYSQKV
jgi:hypothetical protein